MNFKTQGELCSRCLPPRILSESIASRIWSSEKTRPDSSHSSLIDYKYSGVLRRSLHAPVAACFWVAFLPRQVSGPSGKELLWWYTIALFLPSSQCGMAWSRCQYRNIECYPILSSITLHRGAKEKATVESILALL